MLLSEEFLFVSAGIELNKVIFYDHGFRQRQREAVRVSSASFLEPQESERLSGKWKHQVGLFGRFRCIRIFSISILVCILNFIAENSGV